MIDRLGTLSWLASPGASLLFAALCLFWFVARKGNSALTPRRMAPVFMHATALYIFASLMVLQGFFGVPMETTIREGYGGDRLFWVLVFVVLDLSARLLELTRGVGDVE
jgi:hypothetical protein